MSHFGQKADGGAITIERADIDIRTSGFHAERYTVCCEISVDERTDILVGLVPSEPQVVQRLENPARRPLCRRGQPGVRGGDGFLLRGAGGCRGG